MRRALSWPCRTEKARERSTSMPPSRPKIVDLSADFRLRDPALYQRYYGEAHSAPDGYRASSMACLSCTAKKCARQLISAGWAATPRPPTWPCCRSSASGLLAMTPPVIVDIKVGSSEGGASPNPGSHHPERSHVVRTFSPTATATPPKSSRRLGLRNVHLTMTSVDLVRGAWQRRTLLSNPA